LVHHHHRILKVAAEPGVAEQEGEEQKELQNIEV